MKQQIKLKTLRQELISMGCNALIQPKLDKFGGEEVHSSEDKLKAVSGFTGSAGMAIIFLNKAILFVDGRYTIQARNEVDNEWEVCDLTAKSWIKCIKDNLNEKEVVVFDPWIIRAYQYKQLCDQLEKSNISIRPIGNDIYENIWSQRPKASNKDLLQWDEEFAGEKASSKLKRLTSEMIKKDIDALVITQPSQLCWLLNIRGKDTQFTPLFLAFGVVYKDGSVFIFDSRKIKINIKKDLNIKIFKFMEIIEVLKKFQGKRIAINIFHTPFIIEHQLKENNAIIVTSFDSLDKISVRKNIVEIKNIRETHKRDGASVVKFLCWLEENIFKNKINEFEASIKLKEFRSKDKNFICESFPTIAASGSNAAIVHYKPSKHSCDFIDKKYLFLLDSGGQYFDGTTDITRTISFSEQSIYVKSVYTYILKGHIALSKTVFLDGTSGNELDIIARRPLWENGLDYDHGTGHGVGYFLGVHETPPNISRRKSSALEEGMFLSNEPGYYKVDDFGIRIENLMLVQKSNKSNIKKFLKFETVSLCHFENSLINCDLLNLKEKEWINNYHEKVRNKLKPFLSNEEFNWLCKKTYNLI